MVTTKHKRGPSSTERPLVKVPGHKGLFRDENDGTFVIKKYIRGKRVMRILKVADEAGAVAEFQRFMGAVKCGRTVEETITEYLDVLKRVRRVAQSTWCSNHRTLVDHLLPKCPSLLGEVNMTHVEAALIARGSGGEISDNTVAQSLTHIRAFFNHCVKRGYLLASPARLVQGPKVHYEVTDRQRMVPLSLLERLTFAAEPPAKAKLWRSITLALWAMGLRVRTELLRVRAVQLAPDGSSLHIPKSKTRRGRTVPIPDRAVLLAIFEVIEATQVRGSRRQRLRIYEHYVEALHREQERLHLLPAETFTPHALRHSCISRWANVEKQPLRAVQRWAGHSTISMTEKYLRDPEGVRPKPTGLGEDFIEACHTGDDGLTF